MVANGSTIKELRDRRLSTLCSIRECCVKLQPFLLRRLSAPCQLPYAVLPGGFGNLQLARGAQCVDVNYSFSLDMER